MYTDIRIDNVVRKQVTRGATCLVFRYTAQRDEFVRNKASGLYHYLYLVEIALKRHDRVRTSDYLSLKNYANISALKWSFLGKPEDRSSCHHVYLIARSVAPSFGRGGVTGVFWCACVCVCKGRGLHVRVCVCVCVLWCQWERNC